jgi:hypothetical protein
VKAALLWFLGTVVLQVLLDQCTEVFPWLAERLVRQAVRRIPEAERPRWEEEWLEELTSKPGGLAKLLWALWSLPLLRGAGEMGRLLGAPAISETIRARLRMAWQKLRFRAKASPQERAAAPGAEPAPRRIVLVDGASAVEVVGAGAINVMTSYELPRRPGFRRPRLYSFRRRDIAYLSDKEFIEWLAGQRQEVEEHADQRAEEYRKFRDASWKKLSGGS